MHIKFNSSLKIFILDVTKNNRSLAILWIFLIVLSSLFEGVGIASLIPIISGSISSNSHTYAENLPSLFSFFDNFDFTKDPSLGIFIFIASLVISTLTFLAHSRIGQVLQAKYVFEIQDKISKNIFDSKWTFINSKSTGELVNRITNDPSRLGGGFYLFGLIVSNVIYCAIFLLISLTISYQVSLSIIVYSIFVYLVSLPYIKAAYQVGDNLSREISDLQNQSIQLISGVKLIKATATEYSAIKILNQLFLSTKELMIRNAFNIQISKAIFELSGGLLLIGVLIFYTKIPNTNIASIIIVLAIFTRILPKILNIQQSYQSLNAILPIFTSFHDFIIETTKFKEKDKKNKLPEALTSGPLSLELINLNIIDNNKFLLKNINLKIEAGEIIVLLGESGAGKTTFLDVLAGLRQISEGSIKYADINFDYLNIRKIRERIGYVGQDTVFYSDTIKNNILWGGYKINEIKLNDLIKSIGLYDLIKSLPEGLNTPIKNSESITFSGGELQRFSILRALIRNPGLMIMDEVTSALDEQSTEKIVSVISSLRRNVTTIISTHNKRIAEIADQIVLIDRGEIISVTRN